MERKNPKEEIMPWLRKQCEEIATMPRESWAERWFWRVMIILTVIGWLSIVTVASYVLFPGFKLPLSRSDVSAPAFMLPTDCTEEVCPNCEGHRWATVNVVVERFKTRGENGSEDGNGWKVGTLHIDCPLCKATGKVARHKSGCLRMDAYTAKQ